MLHFLLKLQEEIKVDNNKKTSIGGDAIKLTLSKMVALGISMINAMLLSRFRTLEEYGTYSQLLLVINLFTSLFMLGLPNSINYFLTRAEDRTEQKKFLSVYYTLSTVLSVVMGIMLIVTLPLIEAYFNNPAIRTFAFFMAVYPWSYVISSSVENILIVYRKSTFLMLYRIINSISLLGIIVLVQGIGLDFRAYMWLYLMVNVVYALAVYVIAARLCGGLKLSLDKPLIMNIFKFSIPIGLASVVGTLNIEIDKLLIGFLMNTEQLAVYTNASKELPVTIIASSITAVLMPQLTIRLKRGDSKGAILLWKYATELSFMLICLISIGVFTFAEDVLVILYSDKYLSGVNVFRVYDLVLLLRCTYFGMILNSNGNTKPILYSSIATLVLNIVLNLILYRLMGMTGPAVATFISISLTAIYQLILTAKDLNMSLEQIFPWKRILKILLINIVLAVIFSVIKTILPFDNYIGSIVESLVLGAIWTFVYIIIMKNNAIQAWKGLNNK